MDHSEQVLVTDFDYRDHVEEEEEEDFSCCPESSFPHVEAAMDNGVREGMIVEAPYNDGSDEKKFWLAKIEGVFGPLLKLCYVGSGGGGGGDSNNGTSSSSGGGGGGGVGRPIWHDLTRSRLYPLGYCQMNKIELEPPEEIKDTCSEWQSLALQYLEDVRYDTIPMHHIDCDGSTPTERLKSGMIVDVVFDDQEEEEEGEADLTAVWSAVVKNNYGGVLRLAYDQPQNDEEDEEVLEECISYLSTRLVFPNFNEDKRRILPPKRLRERFPDYDEKRWLDLRKKLAELDRKLPPDDLILTEHFFEEHQFEKGMTLEVIHPKNWSKIIPGVITELGDDNSFTVKVTKEGGCYLSCNMSQRNFFPVGWLNKSKTRPKPSEAPKAMFPEPIDPKEMGFEVGKKLELLYFDNHFYIGTIVSIRDSVLVVIIEGDTKQQQLFIPANSLHIFPAGWCYENLVPIWIPKNWEAKPDEKVEKEDEVSVQADESKSSSSWCQPIYFNYKCSSSSFLSKKRLLGLPKRVGPGPVRLVMREILSMIIGSSFKSGSVLKRLECKTTPRKDFYLETMKGKSRVLNLKAEVGIPSKSDQVEDFCKEICTKVGACPYLVSPKLYENECPANCQTRQLDGNGVGGITGGHAGFGGGGGFAVGRPVRKRRHGPHHNNNNVVPPSKSPTPDPVSLPPSAPVSEQPSIVADSSLSSTDETDESSTPPVGVTPPPPKKKKDESLFQFKKPKQKRTSSSSSSFSSLQRENSLPPVRDIQLRTNPRTWTPRETALFLAQTVDCYHLARFMMEDEIDGPAFLLLNYPTVKEYWSLKTLTAIQLCQHVESVKLAYAKSFS